jgi:6-phosphofructokinase 1
LTATGDFELIDHTPGYGSVARYWAYIVQNADQENAGASPSDPVLVLQAMGRKIGFIPAAARLADPKREMPLLILTKESGVTMEEMADRVNDLLHQRGRAVVIVSEGFDVGDIGARKDSFGHTEFGASQVMVAQAVINYLNHVGLAVHGSARANVPGTDQRDTAIYASAVDIDEAYKVGQKAAFIAAEEGSGYMATILREPGPIYRVRYDKVELGLVANSERSFPEEWIAPSRTDVTDDFVRYARPLIGEDWPSVPLVGGLQRFTRFEPIFAEQKLDKYVPQAYRG